MSEFKEYEEWEASLDQKYLKQLSPDAFELSPAAFYAGQQSQQAKIDDLKKKYDAMYNAFIVADDCRKEWHESYMNVRLERDELQARVDRVVHILTYTNHASTPLCNELRDILKGNKDEN